MSGGVLGGGVIFVVAALLWGAVLVPAWLRRREFRAAERNALRLQRTLRVLAETSEVPEEVRLEATAKEALAQEKLLRTAQRRREAEREAMLAEQRAEQVRAEIRAQQMQRKQAAAQRAARLRRPVVRRVRAFSALAVVLGLLGALVGAGLLIAGSGPALLAGSVLLGTTGMGALVLLAPGRARLKTIAAERVEAAPVAEDRVELEPDTSGEAEAAAEAHAVAQRAAAERIARARARALARARAERPASRENQGDSILLREAREQVERARGGAARTADAIGAPTPAPAAGSVDAASRPAAPAAPEASVVPPVPGAEDARTPAVGSRRAPREAERGSAARAAQLRRMGVIGDTSEGMPDLDAVLRRRRNAG